MHRQRTFCILNFHGIGSPMNGLPAAETPYWISRDSLRRVLDMIGGREDVQLTFDDGNRSDVEIVLPELQARRVSATFFPCAGRLSDPRYLCVSALRELSAAGMSIGTHGWSHIPWRSLNPQLQQQEWRHSTQVLSEAIGSLVSTAACPFGAYDRATIKGLRACGITSIFTSDRAWATSSRTLLPRFTLIEKDLPAAARSALVAPGLLARVGDELRIFLKSNRGMVI